MTSEIPGTPEAAYTAFALVDALSELLIKKGIITRVEFDDLLRTVASGLEVAPNFVSKRSAEFIRGAMLGQK